MRNLVVLFLSVMCNLAHGQAYHPLIEANKTWDVVSIAFEVETDCHVLDADRFYFNGDTTIEGMEYQIMWSYAVYGGPSCDPLGVNENSSNQKSFLREDTLLKRVFIYDDYTNTDELLYDFNLAVGDTLVSEYMDIGGDLVVEIIDTVTLANSEQRKIWYFNSGESYVEGIGSSEGPYGYLIQGLGIWNNVYCVKKDDVFIWDEFQDFTGTCFGYLEIADQSAQLLEIYPNPAESEIRIQNLVEPISHLKIISLDGRVVLTEDELSSEIIEVSFLENGYYTIQLETVSGQFYSASFLKM